MEQVLNRAAFTSDLSYGVYLSEIADLRCAAVAPAVSQWKTVADQLNQLDKMLAEARITDKHRSRQFLYRILHDVCGMPAAPSERKPLTDEQVFNFWKDHGGHGFAGMLRAYRAIEQRHVRSAP